MRKETGVGVPIKLDIKGQQNVSILPCAELDIKQQYTLAPDGERECERRTSSDILAIKLSDVDFFVGRFGTAMAKMSKI